MRWLANRGEEKINCIDLVFETRNCKTVRVIISWREMAKYTIIYNNNNNNKKENPKLKE